MTKKISFVFVLLFGIAFTVLLSFRSSNPRTGYVIIEDLYSKFQMKKEMQAKFNDSKNMRQKILDSLAIELRLLANDLNKQKNKDNNLIKVYNLKREQFYEKRNSFDEDNKQLSDQYDKEILAQLNQYVRDYGKKFGFEYIFGNAGSGSLMYAISERDITNEVSDYVNKRYAGKE